MKQRKVEAETPDEQTEDPKKAAVAAAIARAKARKAKQEEPAEKARELPELNEEFVSKFGAADGVEGLKAEVRKNMESAWLKCAVAEVVISSVTSLIATVFLVISLVTCVCSSALVELLVCDVICLADVPVSVLPH